MSSIANRRRKVELQDLMQRLEAIEKEMPKKKEEVTDKGKPKDQFMDAKSKFLAGMMECKNAIRELHDKSKVARSVDHVRKTQAVKGQVRALSKQFTEMEALYNKEARKRRSKLSQEELATRGEFLSQFRTELAKLKKLSSNTGVAGAGADNPDLEDGMDTAAFVRSMAGISGPGASGPGGPKGQEVELTEMQQQSLAQIQQRDEGFDKMLDMIGIAVEAAGEKAKVIQDELKVQERLIDDIQVEVEATTIKVNDANKQMQETLDKIGGAESFCINCMCCILLLGIIGAFLNFAL